MYSMMKKLISNKNMFHLVTNSPWPFMMSMTIFNFLLSFIFFINYKKSDLMLFMMFFLLLIMMYWFNDINLESKEGEHTNNVKDGLKIGMIFFIITEVLFFISWFWGFFHSSLSPINEIGNFWPPIGMLKINPFSIPMLNTFLLLSSGITVTVAHNMFLMNMKINKSMMITIFLGFLFTINQMIEYYESFFTISDSIFGSCFFITTGFHGMHVLVGTVFLIISWVLTQKKELSELTHNNLLSFSIWYWHFVDVVWLFLMIFIYLWS